MNFSTCLYLNFQFPWWSRDHFLAPFKGLYLPNAWSLTLQASKRHTFRVSAFLWYPLIWGKTVSCRVCAGQSKGTLKTWKCCFLIWPTLQNSGIFHDSSRPHLHFRWFAAEIAAIRRLYIGFRVCYKYYRKKHSHFSLAWSRPRADHGLSLSTSVFHIIGVCKILSSSVEIWQYEVQQPVFE